jgi:hypothetical protein
MPAITITDLENAKTDVDHLAAIANSTALTATDRLGRPKQTIAGLSAEFPNAAANAAAAAASATQAANEATSAQTSVGLATNQATAAQASRVAAESARDAAFVNANVYASTAAGLAATTDGEQFQVVSGNEIIRYVRTNSTTATEVARYASSAGSMIYRGAPATASLDFNTTTSSGLWLINGPQYNPPPGVLYPGLLTVKNFGTWAYQEYIPTAGSIQYGGQRWSRIIGISPSSIGDWVANYGYAGTTSAGTGLDGIRTAGLYTVSGIATGKPSDPESPAVSAAALIVDVVGDTIYQRYVGRNAAFSGLVWSRTITISTNTVGAWKRSDNYSGDLSTDVNANTLTNTGTYLVTVQQTNAPEVSGWLNVSQRNGWVLQEMISLDGARRWVRNYRISNSTWSAWVEARAVIATSAVTTDKIAPSSVTTEKIAAYAVTTGLIAGEAVDSSKLSAKHDWVATISTGDVNDYTTKSGGWMVAGAMTNAPTGSGWLFVHKFGGAGNFILQRWHDFTDPSIFWVRKNYNGTWSAWAKLVQPQVLPKTGKNVVCLGDSITENGDYPARLATLTGATVTNCGFGGSRLAFSTGDYAYLSFHKLADYISSGNYTDLIAACDRLAGAPVYDDNRAIAARLAAVNWSTVDYIVAGYGTNDYGSPDVPLGVATDTTGASFRGAINYAVNKICTAYPHIKILFVSPIWRARYDSVGDGKDSDTYANSRGATLIDFVDAMKEMAALNKIPCIDMYRTSGINKYTGSTLLSDGLHPTAGIGYQRIAEKVAAGLNANW